MRRGQTSRNVTYAGCLFKICKPANDAAIIDSSARTRTAESGRDGCRQPSRSSSRLAAASEPPGRFNMTGTRAIIARELGSLTIRRSASKGGVCDAIPPQHAVPRPPSALCHLQ